MIRAGLVFAAVAVALTGCTPPPDAGLPLPEPAMRMTPRDGVTWPAARGEASMVVRTVAGGVEVPGAECRAESNLFQAGFRTPARLLLPDFGEASPSLRIACRDGAASGVVEARPRIGWAQDAYGGWPAVGVSVGTGGYGGVGVGMSWYGGGGGAGAVPAVRYPDVEVVLAP